MAPRGQVGHYFALSPSFQWFDKECKLNVAKEYDVFISHASEDKDNFVRPLVEALAAEGLRVWYDEFELRLGDSLRQKIDYGLAHSRFGVVVISPSFFDKNWTLYELDGLTAMQMTGERVILPVWHEITRDEVLAYSPSLADIVAADSAKQSVLQIAAEIGAAMGSGASIATPQSSRVTPDSVSSGFAVFYVAPANMEELDTGETPQPSFFPLAEIEARWLSMVSNDQELEFRIEGTKLRLRLDWGNTLSGDEIVAHRLVSGNEPFALTIRPSEGKQMYFPVVENASPSQSWLTGSNPSGWMVFEVLSVQ